ncbi:uncharacterized protein LOC144452491 [Glandiceps talaboti]
MCLCLTFILLETAKQIVIYGSKQYNGGKYPLSLSTIVALSELTKLIVCASIYGYSGNIKSFELSWKFAIPSLLYGMNNNLFLYALHYTPPPLWNVLIQSRVLMTALVYRIVFKRVIPPLRWLALLLLIFGIALAEISGSSTGHSIQETTMRLYLRALILSIVSAVLSTAASVYTEYLFKNNDRPFMEQQVQLYLFGFSMTSIWALYVTKGHPFQVSGHLSIGVIWLLIAAVIFGGCGGLVVAGIIKLIDNITKIYSSIIAILVTAFICAGLFPRNFTINIMYLGSIVVILVSSVLYERAKPKKRTISVMDVRENKTVVTSQPEIS